MIAFASSVSPSFPSIRKELEIDDLRPLIFNNFIGFGLGSNLIDIFSIRTLWASSLVRMLGIEVLGNDETKGGVSLGWGYGMNYFQKG